MRAGLCACAGVAILLAVWANAGWLSVTGITLMISGICTSEFATTLAGSRAAWRVALVGLWVLGLGLARSPVTLWTMEAYFAFVPWLLAAAGLLPEWGRRAAGERLRWRALALLLAFGGDAPWLAAAYLLNNFVTFLAGLLVALGLLILAKAWLPLRPWAVQTVNTLILLVVGLPLADFLVSPA